MLSKIKFPNWKPFLTAGFVFSLLSYFFVISPYGNLVTLEIYLDANKAGVMQIFPPLKSGGYSGDNARKVKYPRGKSGHLLAVRVDHSRAPLRIDPMGKIGQVNIQKLSAIHFGINRTQQGAGLKPYIRDCDQASCEVSEDGVLINATGIDSKLFIKSAFIPALSWWKIIAGMGVIYLLVYVLAQSLIARPSKSKLFISEATLPRLILLGCLAFYFLSDKAPIFSALLGIMLITGILIMSFNSLAIGKTYIARNIESLLIISCALLIIIGGLCLTFTQSFFDNAVAMIASNETESNAIGDDSRDIRSNIENLYTDHFSAKDTLINLDAKAKIFGLGFTPNSKSILGKDGWYFEGYGGRRVEKDIIKSFDNITDYMGLLPFKQEELEQWKVVLEERYYWLKERGIDYVFALAPTKALIYPEKLPARILSLKNSLHRETRYQQLVQYLAENSVVPVVDLQADLLKVRDKHAWPLFYRTDFHWNYLGAFYAYKGIMDVIAQRYPKYQFTPLTLGEFRIEANHQWAHHTFLSLAGLNPQEHQDDTYLKFFPNSNNRYDSDSVFYQRGIYDDTIPRMVTTHYPNNQRAALRTLTNEKGKIENIFVIGDSFSEKMTGYFSAHAKTVLNYRTVTEFMVEPIEQFKPQIVIQEILNMYVLGAPPRNPRELRGYSKTTR